MFVEGGGVTVSSFLEAGLLDRLHIAVAPLLIGEGRPQCACRPGCGCRTACGCSTASIVPGSISCSTVICGPPRECTTEGHDLDGAATTIQRVLVAATLLRCARVTCREHCGDTPRKRPPGLEPLPRNQCAASASAARSAGWLSTRASARLQRVASPGSTRSPASDPTQLCNGTRVRTDDRQSMRQRFGDRHAVALALRRQHEHIGSVDSTRRVHWCGTSSSSCTRDSAARTLQQPSRSRSHRPGAAVRLPTQVSCHGRARRAARAPRVVAHDPCRR